MPKLSFPAKTAIRLAKSIITLRKQLDREEAKFSKAFNAIKDEEMDLVIEKTKAL